MAGGGAGELDVHHHVFAYLVRPRTPAPPPLSPRAPPQERTPLHWAAYNGHTEAVAALVAARADVNAKGVSDGGAGGLGGKGRVCGR